MVWLYRIIVIKNYMNAFSEMTARKKQKWITEKALEVS